MVKHTLFLLWLLTTASGFISCTHQTKEEKSSSTASTAQQEIGRSNFAVILQWATDDAALIHQNMPLVLKELAELWQQDIIENAYYNKDSTSTKPDHFPRIAFFIKAKDKTKAKSALDQLTVVTNETASYTLHPVGQLWLGRKTEIIAEMGLTPSFAAVWTTEKSPLHGENADSLLKQQSDTIIKLWESGVVENVYFDIEGSYTPNNKTDFVFFVNAATEIEAKQICESLPFFKEKIASYQMHHVGVFWMGQYHAK